LAIAKTGELDVSLRERARKIGMGPWNDAWLDAISFYRNVFLFSDDLHRSDADLIPLSTQTWGLARDEISGSVLS